jgi:hypothetical protein
MMWSLVAQFFVVKEEDSVLDIHTLASMHGTIKPVIGQIMSSILNQSSWHLLSPFREYRSHTYSSPSSAVATARVGERTALMQLWDKLKRCIGLDFIEYTDSVT